MLARELMTRNPTAVLPTDSLTHAAELMRLLNIGALLVVRDFESNHLQGIVTDRDIVVRYVASGDGARATVESCMTRELLATVSPDVPVDVVLVQMERRRVRRIPVVGPDGRLVGLIAHADLARHIGPNAPEKIVELVERISEPTLPSLIRKPALSDLRA